MTETDSSKEILLNDLFDCKLLFFWGVANKMEAYISAKMITATLYYYIALKKQLQNHFNFTLTCNLLESGVSLGSTVHASRLFVYCLTWICQEGSHVRSMQLFLHFVKHFQH